ncbi:MAG: hypothetical protein LBG74_05005, partial [Spirochaetaceae bacterium]|nr:hypothetical protein [Spirochaetaceae bacterium]
MEELRGTAALDKEILADAERQEARILKAAEKRAKEMAEASEQKLAAALKEESARFEAKTAEQERELASRLALDKQRAQTEKLDALLKTAAASFAASLTPEQKEAFRQKSLEKRERYAKTVAGDSTNYTIQYSLQDELDALISAKRSVLLDALLGGVDSEQWTVDSKQGIGDRGQGTVGSESKPGANADNIVSTDIPDKNLPTTPGSITRVSGPIIHIEGLSGAGLFDVVEVGERRIIGEIVRIDGDEAVVQVYEDSTGLKTGGPAWATGRPLSVLLGPGL